MSTFAASPSTGSTDSAVSPTRSTHDFVKNPTVSTESAPSTAASLRRHAILADLSLLQVATLVGTGLLVALGVVLGGRSYITTVSPEGLISSQPSTHGSAEKPTTSSDGSSPVAL
ncbi:hypothetical protein [uncultured Actinomyces sp.]|jgi:hypothetical protein avisC_04337|uniref:hypothetical protein n=1 Tax=uncultured Actinomyces sp. TaxID=249061 RepID=UPI0028D000C3|nr:hypothetical protein [uncultured Actinomyces sp.]